MFVRRGEDGFSDNLECTCSRAGRIRYRVHESYDDPLVHECSYDRLARECPSFHRPLFEHLDLSRLIRTAPSTEIRHTIIRDNVPAYNRNRGPAPLDMEDLMYPIRNRYGEYPTYFDRPREATYFYRDLSCKRLSLLPRHSVDLQKGSWRSVLEQ